MLRGSKVFKAAIFQFLVYNIPIVYLGFLCTCIAKSMAKFSNPAGISQTLLLY
jgi:hypothetical protein